MGDGHGAEDQQRVHAEGDVGQETGRLVVPQHEQDDESQADDAGQGAAADGVRAERRVRAEFGVDFDGDGDVAGGDDDGEALRLFKREAAGDFGVAAGDGVVDAGRAVNAAVQHDGQHAADVRSGHFAEGDGAALVEAQADGPVAELVHVRGGARHVAALDAFGFLLDEDDLRRLHAVALFRDLLADQVGGNVELAAVVDGVIIILNQRGVVFGDQMEFQFGRVFDGLADVGLVAFVDGRHADGDRRVAGSLDFRLRHAQFVEAVFENRLDAVADVRRHFAVLQIVFVETDDEFGTALQVKTEDHATGGLAAQIAQHDGVGGVLHAGDGNIVAQMDRVFVFTALGGALQNAEGGHRGVVRLDGGDTRLQVIERLGLDGVRILLLKRLVFLAGLVFHLVQLLFRLFKRADGFGRLVQFRHRPA